MRRPENHVTRALDAFRDPQGISHLPILEERQLQVLENLYPPACLGRSDTVEEHLRYAGKVELVASLRAAAERATESEDNLSNAERAS